MSNKITALYARNAKADAESIGHQKEELLNFAKEKNFGNLILFSDNGCSAGLHDKPENRPVLSDLMNAVRNDKVDTVIVVNLTRLSHIMLTVYDLMREMEDHGVRFIAIEDHIDALPKHMIPAKIPLPAELKSSFALRSERFTPLRPEGFFLPDL